MAPQTKPPVLADPCIRRPMPAETVLVTRLEAK